MSEAMATNRAMVPLNGPVDLRINSPLSRISKDLASGPLRFKETRSPLSPSAASSLPAKRLNNLRQNIVLKKKKRNKVRD